MRTMTIEQIQRVAPSVFATEPYHGMSERYRFFSTAHVVEGLMAQGFAVVRAQQSRSRIEGKEAYTRHLLRFRHASQADAAVQSVIPEVVLTNSHDGTSAYKLSLGLFRVLCLNGLVVQSAGIEDIKVRHSGRESLVGEVIEASYRVIDQAPKALAQVEQWQHLQLSPPEQEVLAEAALELRESTLEVQPRALLMPRRWEDGDPNRDRDIWRTMNTVQENLMRGGVQGRNEQGQRRRLRGITSVDTDTKLNRALWVLTEKMAALKA
jgi:hypothetical protein